jgi:hypothetical protein
MEPAPTRPRHEAIDHDDLLVHDWRPRSPGSHPGGSNDRGSPGGCGAGAARSRSSRGQSSRASSHEHRRGPEDHHDRRDDGPDQRPGLHPLLVRSRHADRREMLRQLRRVLATRNRHRRGQAKGNNLNLNGGLWHEVRVSR